VRVDNGRAVVQLLRARRDRICRRLRNDATGIARAIAQRTVLIAVSFLVLTLATQGDDRVDSGRAQRRDVTREKCNDHEDHRHSDKHSRIKRSNSVEHT
jgi:hypothetical protein